MQMHFSPPSAQKCSMCSATCGTVTTSVSAIKGGAKQMPASPPRRTISRNISSVRLRPCPHTACELEWEAIKGFCATSTASQKLLKERCDTS